jgi:hypothetical protein
VDAIKAKVQAWVRDEPVTVVSGLPRSGTSMMMHVLERGGLEPLTDHERGPDADNPEGYYEYEPVKRLEHGDTGWIDEAQGKAVKVISALLEHLPDDHEYRVIVMRRELDEVLASQRRMLERRGEGSDAVDEAELKEQFEEHLRRVEAWARNQDNVEFISANYNEIFDAPRRELERIEAFLDASLDVDAMCEGVDPSLYRNRG